MSIEQKATGETLYLASMENQSLFLGVDGLLGSWKDKNNFLRLEKFQPILDQFNRKFMSGLTSGV
jgi:hypothetical protein